MMRRRALLSTFPVLAAAPAVASPDAALLSLHADWLRTVAEYERLGSQEDAASTDAEADHIAGLRDGIGREMDKLEDRISAIPADTMAGVKVKANLWAFHWDPTREKLETSLLHDLLKGVAA